MTALADAFAEYVDKHQHPGQRPRLFLGARGYWHPPLDDTCTLCDGARWTSNSGSHLHSVEHIALKHGVDIRDLKVLIVTCTLPPYSAVPIPELEPVPDVPSTDVAWKALSLVLDDQGERVLASRGEDFLWRPHEVTQAYCAKMGLSEGACMGETCSCGLYFFWQVAEAIAYSTGRAVIVRAQIGGTIVECVDGCRAEYAVITGVLLYHNESFVRIASELYGVPVIDLNDKETLWTI